MRLDLGRLPAAKLPQRLTATVRARIAGCDAADSSMRHESIIAAVVLAAIALLVAGYMVETYWDCRLMQHKSYRDCVPPTGRGGIGGI
jgi:hypothetical protein